MEQKTPARGNAFWRLRSTAEDAPIPAAQATPPGSSVALARDLAARVITILPSDFSSVLPRGYTISGHHLVMARFEMEGSRGMALYGRHTHWGEREANVFLRDLNEGWLTELSAFMRWQLRQDPVSNAVFQHALVHLHHETQQRLEAGQ